MTRRSTLSDERRRPRKKYGSDREKHQEKYRTNETHFKNDSQKLMSDVIREFDCTCILGPAGVGKTHIAVIEALRSLRNGLHKRLVITRPAVDAGESLGFLPGKLESKLDPYLRPILDILSEEAGQNILNNYIRDRTIEIAPVAFMRGRTFKHSFIIIDEAQNCTYEQLKMVLTRLGEGSKMVLTGDPKQSDLQGPNQFQRIADLLSNSPRIGVVTLDTSHIVRHSLVTEILEMIEGVDQEQESAPVIGFRPGR